MTRRPSARFKPLTASEYEAQSAARIAEHRAAVASTRERVLAHMRQHAPRELYSVEVATALGVTVNFTRSVLMELERRGVLTSTWRACDGIDGPLSGSGQGRRYYRVAQWP